MRGIGRGRGHHGGRKQLQAEKFRAKALRQQRLVPTKTQEKQQLEVREQAVAKEAYL